jgi:hypothetical protein
MEELFQTILGFIPVALFITLRILAVRRKQARQQQEASPAPPPGPSLPGRGGPVTGAYGDDESSAVLPAPSVVRAKPQALPRTDKGEVFSAWNLPVDSAGAAGSVTAGGTPRAAVKGLGEIQPLKPVPHPAFEAAQAIGAAAEISPEPAMARPRGIRQAGSGRGFPENLDHLPVLKRAVVLAEILGPPKGI